MNLPKGQKARTDFPRFGLPQFTNRFPDKPNDRAFEVTINSSEPVLFDLDKISDSGTTITADFHCVTTWSYPSAKWQGISFKEFYSNHIESKMDGTQSNAGCVFSAQDGAKISLLLVDLLKDNVLIADKLDEEPLSIAHGAPLRLVAPSHYGYKNIKHLKRIEFYDNLPEIKRGFAAFLEHPRARVEFEERGRWVPGWILRYLYRPLIGSTVRDFSKALEKKV